MRCAAQLALAFALLTISIGAGLFLSSGNTLRGQVASPHFHIFVKEVETSDSPFIDISENTGLAISTPYSAPFQFLISVPSARWMELPLDNTLIRVSAKKDGQEVMDGIENSSEVNAAAVFYDSPYPPLCSLEYPCLTSLVFMSAAAVIPGTYNITISANDGTDATSAAFTWTVLPEESNGSASSKEVISPLPSSAPDSNTPPSSSPPSASVPASQASASASSVPTSQGSASTASAPASAASATTDASSSEKSQASSAASSGASSKETITKGGTRCIQKDCDREKTACDTVQCIADVCAHTKLPDGTPCVSDRFTGRCENGICLPMRGAAPNSSTVASSSPPSSATDASSSEESQEDTQKKVFCCDVVTESTTPVSFFLRVYIPSLWEKSKWPTCKASVFVQSFEQAKVLCDRLLQEKAQRPTAPTDGDNGTGWDGNSDGEEEGGGGEGGEGGEGGGRGGEDGSDDTADDDGGGGGGSSSAGGGGDECCVDADGTISDPLPPPSTFAGKALTAAKEAVEWVIDLFTDVELNSRCGGNAVLTTGALCGGGGGSSASCGDGVCDEDEYTVCEDDCSIPTCGDGELDELIEECDDGNFEDGDGCSAVCSAEEDEGVDAAVCGDGVPHEEEECDDGNVKDDAEDDTETPACSDGDDNDSDGKSDARDIGCFTTDNLDACASCAQGDLDQLSDSALDLLLMGAPFEPVSQEGIAYFYDPTGFSEVSPCEESSGGSSPLAQLLPPPSMRRCNAPADCLPDESCDRPCPTARGFCNKKAVHLLVRPNVIPRCTNDPKYSSPPWNQFVKGTFALRPTYRENLSACLESETGRREVTCCNVDAIPVCRPHDLANDAYYVKPGGSNPCSQLSNKIFHETVARNYFPSPDDNVITCNNDTCLKKYAAVYPADNSFPACTNQPYFRDACARKVAGECVAAYVPHKPRLIDNSSPTGSKREKGRLALNVLFNTLNECRQAIQGSASSCKPLGGNCAEAACCPQPNVGGPRVLCRNDRCAVAPPGVSGWCRPAGATCTIGAAVNYCAGLSCAVGNEVCLNMGLGGLSDIDAGRLQPSIAAFKTAFNGLAVPAVPAAPAGGVAGCWKNAKGSNQIKYIRDYGQWVSAVHNTLHAQCFSPQPPGPKATACWQWVRTWRRIYFQEFYQVANNIYKKLLGFPVS